MNLGARKNAF